MSISALEAQAETAQVILLEDGMVVRLSGGLDTEEALVALRAALLTPRPEGVRDVVVDAGQVTAVSDSAVAVLWAALAWAESTDRRMRFCGMSAPLTRTLEELGLSDELPRLDRSAAALAGHRLAAD
jgi:anti-anti-sigma regulatory factor